MIERLLFPAVLVGALLGWGLAELMPDSAVAMELAALAKTTFLAMLKMIVAPLVLLSIISGILQLDAAVQLRRMGGITLAYYLFTTVAAIGIGLSIVFVFHPWTSAPPLDALPVASTEAQLLTRTDGSFWGLLQGLATMMLVNPFNALANLNILGIVANGIVFGLALLLVVPVDSPLRRSIHDATRAVYKIAGWAIWIVPVGVIGITYQMASTADLSLLRQLAAFCGVVVGATLVHGLIVLPAIAWIVGRVHPRRLAAAAARPFVVALSSSSSAATLPVTFRAAEKLEVSESTASFVLPLGATTNMDGTALFEGIAAVFLAYLFGIPLDTMATVTVFLTAMLASIGAPGIPSGSMAGMQMVLLAVGIPLEGILILLLVERPLDTIRTAVNVEGDLIGAIVADRFFRSFRAPERGALVVADCRLLLIRHGLIKANRQQVWHGSTDSQLLRRGRGQARRLARALQTEELTAIVASPLRRCVDTAAPLAQNTELEVEVDERLREWSVGEWEGRPYRWLHEEHDFFDVTTKDPEFAPPEGESLRQVAERMVEALQDISQRYHDGARVAVVTHGAATAVAVAALLDGDPTLWRNYSFINCGVSELVLDSGPPYLSSYNEMF